MEKKATENTLDIRADLFAARLWFVRHKHALEKYFPSERADKVNIVHLSEILRHTK